MDLRKELLLKTAARLYSLGIELEAVKEQIRELSKAGVGYDSQEMQQAVSNYIELKELWDGLEKDYLQYRSDAFKCDHGDC